jgi:hypothetical protein
MNFAAFWQTGREQIARAFGRVELAPAIVVFVAALAAIAVLLIEPRNAARLAQFLPEHIESLQILDNAPQRHAYFAFFFAVVFGALALAFLMRNRAAKFLSPALATALGVLLVIALLSTLSRPREGLLAVPVLVGAVLLAGRARYRNALWFILVAFLALAIVPGLAGTPILNPLIYFAFDTHYTPFFAHGERIAAGKVLFADIFPDYSPLIAVVTGAFAKAGAALTLGLSVRAVQAMQTLCLLAFIFACWERTKASDGGGRLLALFVTALTAAPWLGTLAAPLWQPTGSGMRFILLPIAAYAACKLGSLRPLNAGILVGAFAGAGILYNLETGIASAAGLSIGWLLRMRGEKFSLALRSMIAGIVSFAAVIAAFVVLYRGLFGVWPLPDSLQSFAELALLFSSGYGGTRLQFRPIVAIIALHAAYILVRALRASFDKNAEAPDVASAAIATMLLVLFPYYVNRPVDWNLWIFIAVYSLLIAPLVADSRRRLVPLAIAAFVMAPPALNLVRPHLIQPLARSQLAWGWQSGCVDGIVVSGTPGYCAAIKSRADTAKTSGTPLVVTRMPYTILRTTGDTGSLRSIDVFGMAPTNAAFAALVREIKEQKPSAILFDDPEDQLFPLKAEAINNFNKRLRDAVSGYCLARTTNGWQIFERADNCPQTRR